MKRGSVHEGDAKENVIFTVLKQYIVSCCPFVLKGGGEDGMEKWKRVLSKHWK